MKLRGWLVLLVVAAIGYANVVQREVSQPDGVLAAQPPLQADMVNATAFTYRDHLFLPQATFDITARVLSREAYRFGREAEVSPLDLALGWGRMSDQRVLAQIDISQHGRFYFWRTQREPPIPVREIRESSANMHLVPASDEVGEALDGIREGHVVHLRGYLVNIRGADGWRWESSLQRTDSGKGACELIWVEQVEIVDQG